MVGQEATVGQVLLPRLLKWQRDRVAIAAPTTAVHSDLGVRITAPPRTESSIPVRMATNPVRTRRPAFNTMSPQPVGATRPVDPD
eukprot:2124942-Pleurochrysis_carterae.AAC.1